MELPTFADLLKEETSKLRDVAGLERLRDELADLEQEKSKWVSASEDEAQAMAQAALGTAIQVYTDFMNRKSVYDALEEERKEWETKMQAVCDVYRLNHLSLTIRWNISSRSQESETETRRKLAELGFVGSGFPDLGKNFREERIRQLDEKIYYRKRHLDFAELGQSERNNFLNELRLDDGEGVGLRWRLDDLPTMFSEMYRFAKSHPNYTFISADDPVARTIGWRAFHVVGDLEYSRVWTISLVKAKFSIENVVRPVKDMVQNCKGRRNIAVLLNRRVPVYLWYPLDESDKTPGS